eukprot:752805_1
MACFFGSNEEKEKTDALQAEILSLKRELIALKQTNIEAEASSSNSDNDTSQKQQNVKTIGTHHGTFHCDEVLACYMLRNHTKEFRNAKIIRSRDPNILPR